MSKLGMVRVRGTLCRTRRGKFTKCRKPISKGKGKGFAKRHTKGIKGRCVKWSKGRTRCVKREHSALGYKRRRRTIKGGYKRKGACIRWNRGKTRCLKRAA